MNLLTMKCVVDPKFTGDEEVPVYLELVASDTVADIFQYITEVLGRQWPARNWTLADLTGELGVELPRLKDGPGGEEVMEISTEDGDFDVLIRAERNYGMRLSMVDFEILETRGMPTLDKKTKLRVEQVLRRLLLSS